GAIFTGAQLSDDPSGKWILLRIATDGITEETLDTRLAFELRLSLHLKQFGGDTNAMQETPDPVTP
ncbi:MAG: hypothetical protein KC983_10770, partial [Phycisphaerales bacterium]|nr:hypothetical protein [Phycisphaerales bacterium]